MKRCSASLVARKGCLHISPANQNNKTMGCHFTLHRLATEQTIDNRDIGKALESSEHTYVAGGIVKWCSHLENSFVVPHKVKYRATI